MFPTLMHWIVISIISAASSHTQLYNPYYNFVRYITPHRNNLDATQSEFLTHMPSKIETLEQNLAASYLTTLNFLPAINILAENPRSLGTNFGVIPMILISQENLRFFSNVHVMDVSKKRPTLTVKTDENILVECIPAAKITFKEPLPVYSLKTTIIFPTDISVTYKYYEIPLTVGAIIAPADENAYVSPQSPVFVKEVYAVPTKPVIVNYINSNDILEFPEAEAVIVESDFELPAKNVTILEFPEKIADPVVEVNQQEDELVNRNPPSPLAPAGIVQSTQPQRKVEVFHNPKESPLLISMRKESKKKRL